MSAAQLEARRKAGLSTSNPTHACSGALRTPNQTAKRSVTRISDLNQDGRNKKENELDPDTQLEKQTFAAGARILDTYHESRPCSPNEAFGFELIRTGGLTVY